MPNYAQPADIHDLRRSTPADEWDDLDLGEPAPGLTLPQRPSETSDVPQFGVEGILAAEEQAEEQKKFDFFLDRQRRIRRAQRIVDAEIREEEAATSFIGPAYLPPTFTDFRKYFRTDEPERFVIGAADGYCPIMAHGDILSITGEGKGGKTTVILNLVENLSAGEPALGKFPVPEGYFVVVLDGEMTPEKWGHKMAKIATCSDQFTCWPFRGGTLDLTTQHGMDIVVGLLAQAALVTNREIILVIDNFATFSASIENENDNVAVARFYDNLHQIINAANLAGIILVNHAGHSGNRARGASAHIAKPDSILDMTAQNPPAFQQKGRHTGQGRTKIQTLYDPATGRVTVRDDVASASPTTTVDRPPSLRERLATEVLKDPGKSFTTYVRLISNRRYKELRTTAEELIDQGHLMKRMHGGGMFLHPGPLAEGSQ
jgi:hypothetical protein